MATPEKKVYNTGSDAMTALADICARYPAIKPCNIELFAPVYYPIAMVELRLAEQTFEDFETVQLTILRLVALGMHDAGIIGKTLGLSTSYVRKVLRLLQGYGHLNQQGLTQLGADSLKQQQKIVINETVQTFQMDALNGTLLKVEQVVAENSLSELADTHFLMGHLSHLEGISEQTLRDQLMGQGGNAFIHRDKGILHANVTGIRDARCAGVRYARAYMLKLAGQSLPIVLTKRYNKAQKELSQRFTWQPFSVGNSVIANSLGFDPGTVVGSLHANEYLLQLLDMLAQEQQSRPVKPEEVLRAAGKVCRLHTEQLRTYERDRRICVEIPEQAVAAVNGRLLRLLVKCHKEGEQLLTNEHLYGRLISLRVTGNTLQTLGQKLAAMDEDTLKNTTKKLLEQFRDYDDHVPLPQAMLAAINE